MARALVIDDDVANGRIVTKYLQREGHQVTTQTESRRGLDAAIANPPDLVILDVMMPDLDGFSVCRELRAAEPTRDVPVIFLSARADLQDRIHGLDEGAVDYLVKPVMPEELLARVRAALRTKALQDQLRAANAELQTADRHRQDLVSMLAHDIRGMISAVSSAVEMARLDLEDLPSRDAHRFLGIAERNAAELIELTTNLLDSYRLSEGRLRPRAQAVSLAAVADEIVDRLAAQAVQRDVRLEVVGEPVEHVQADVDLLGRVLLNLVTNAVKFTPPGSRVQIDLEANLAPPAGQDGIVVSVQDEGPGVAPEHRAQLFERFTPLALPGGRRPVGSGLGLAFCRQALELMGGAIWLADTPGPGSTFAFVVPRLARPEAV
ncbi:MAG: response regulator [Chloroflexi bacterium]|nr:response regulator [Chloroflexota bacterium]